jgi:hypothetical protein
MLVSEEKFEKTETEPKTSPNKGHYKKNLIEAGIRKSLNETEHYQFINMVFAHWNDKNRHYSKRSVIEILGFYSAIQEYKNFSDSALKLQSTLIKMYRKKSNDFDDESGDQNENPHGKGISAKSEKKEKTSNAENMEEINSMVMIE